MAAPVLISLPDTITILAAPLETSTDGYNARVRNWSQAVSTVVDAFVQPVTTAELLETGARDQIVTRYRVWLEPHVVITADDRIQWGSVLLAVDGQPQYWHDLFGDPDHIELLAVVSVG